MVLIGGGLHCRVAASLPEALLPSAGVTDCLACNPSYMYTHALQMQVSVNASSCTTELVLTTAQQGCSRGEGAALYHAFELVHVHTASCTACLV